MKPLGLLGLILIRAWLFLACGCGGQPNPRPSPEEQATAKVNAIKRLADEMAKDADGVEARGALEEFRNTAFDPQTHPKHAEEIAQVYRQRIQGKYKGFVAQELQAEMGQFLARPKPGK
ncbi:MAG: hypothetical protein L0Z62_16855 [Gemmataceae bacterium]|nr:hypothetical protein [Gemmataceae bacterium]